MMMATASIASTTTKIRVSVARSRATRSPTKDPPPKPDVMSDQDKSLVVRKEINRWCGCRMKVGLTGFRCRCGELFCWLDISACVQLAEVSEIDKLKGLIVQR
ncbi:Zinc finger A20 and AN1 domain-containing stress-associated protein 5 [Linum perenne]